MKNVMMEVTGQKLTITVDLTQDNGPSSTGKTRIIATSAGNKPVPSTDGIMIGLNVYKKIEKQ